MGYSWQTCPLKIKNRIIDLKDEMKTVLDGNFEGFYLHGSLAMGGFNPIRSDIDILVITSNPIDMKQKRSLARLFLDFSNNPNPIEISILNQSQLSPWRHPCPYDFHYSEAWRKRYEEDLMKGSHHFIKDGCHTDPDIAAHITMTYHRGICVEGKGIKDVFQKVPDKDFLSSILGDFHDCLENIEKDPIYCSLNMIRVYWYLKEGVLSSKEEAGKWAMYSLPRELQKVIQKVMTIYVSEHKEGLLEKEELVLFKKTLSKQIHQFLNS